MRQRSDDGIETLLDKAYKDYLRLMDSIRTAGNQKIRSEGRRLFKLYAFMVYDIGYSDGWYDRSGAARVVGYHPKTKGKMCEYRNIQFAADTMGVSPVELKEHIDNKTLFRGCIYRLRVLDI